MAKQRKRTVWVLGDQLHRGIASLADATPSDTRILLVRSLGKATSKRFHRQRVHLVWTGLERFGREMEAEGFEVDRRTAPSLATGLAAHRIDVGDPDVACMEPMSWDGLRLLERLDVHVVRSNQFLCHRDEFAAWAGDRPRTKMDDFYRFQRRRLGHLMDGSEPVGGRWSFDHENRLPPPRDGGSWVAPVVDELDDLDREVIAALPDTCVGDEPWGLWATSRAGALARLDQFVTHVLPGFGPHEDAMLHDEPRLAHAMLSHALNVGLLHPAEVADATEAAYRSGAVPIASAEGFLRQVIGWREYVWGDYWRWMPGYRDDNALGAHRPLPPVFTFEAQTEMRCVAGALDGVRRRGWNHHIERLMVLGNLALLSGVEPQAMTDWMWRSYVDGAEWVMLPNLVGMSLHADGGRMATKPYAGGGAYVNRMSDHCKPCRFDPKRRVGPDACPFTTLYWDFLARHQDRFAANHRMAQPLAGLRRLPDLPAVRQRAAEILALLDEGRL